MISLVDDADILSPAQMSSQLAKLTGGTAVEADYYGNGGAVDTLEKRFASLLGKERAVMFPTGTLANLCAIRRLSGPDHARILVHRDGHFYNDAGDNLSALGRFTMVPVAGAGAGFDVDDVEAEIARAANARVESRLGCIAIESPSRRLAGRQFGADRIQRVAQLAQANHIPLFLDGARLLIECAVTGQTPAQMAAPFDMVYTSLYKYLDAPFGCILAGRAADLDNIYHERRAYGGGLWQMWPSAVLALDKLNRFDAIWRDVIAHANAVFDELQGSPISVTKFEDGTNAVRLRWPKAPSDPDAFIHKAQSLGLKLPAFQGNQMTIKFNDSWLKCAPEELSAKLKELAI